jgi:class 3 adenylate cyclase/predicted ATPase
MKCPLCHWEQHALGKFCDMCGAPLTIVYCPACNEPNRLNARFCASCGNPLIPDSAHPVDNSSTLSRHQAEPAERRLLTVLFCDLVGSTALSVDLDPEDLREVIGTYNRRCAEVITAAGGYVSRYMGDGILAYFGYPQAHEDDPERAIRAGLELARAVSRLELNLRTPLQVRVGVATGMVVVDSVTGEGAAKQGGVVGVTPNLAARLQAIAEAGQVVISQSTWELTQGFFDCAELELITVKGLADSVRAWRVLETSSVRSRFEARHGSKLTGLVGRNEEVALLMRRWRQAVQGEGNVVLISGEPGIGKSRIAHVLLERIRDAPHISIRQFCSPHSQNSALHPIIEHLKDAAGFRSNDTDEQRLKKLESVVEGTEQRSESVGLLAALLSLPAGDRFPPVDLAPQQLKEKTIRFLGAQLNHLAARHPVFYIVEDLHWIDPTTLEVLNRLVERVSSRPILVVLTFRPEFSAPWVGLSNVTTLILNRLTRSQRAEMVARVTGGKLLPKSVVDEIVGRTDGVPLFIEELTKVVVESGVLSATHDLPAARQAALSIPTTLRASLLARLDRSPQMRAVAQIGAALGRRFSHDMISAVAQMPQPDLDQALAQLVNAELLFQRGTVPDAAYTFKHALVQDAAYGTLLRQRRQHVHAHITEVLEKRFPDIAKTQPAVLARHATEAGLVEPAIGYWLRAGQQAVARSAMKEATVQLQKGMDLLKGLPATPSRDQQELDLQVTLGRALVATRGNSAPEVDQTFARAQVLAERVGRPEYLVPPLHGRWGFHMVRSELKLALSCAEKVLAIGEYRNDAAVTFLGHYMSGMVRFYLGEFDAARIDFDRCEQIGDPAHRAVHAGLTTADSYASSNSHFAWTLICLGHTDEARSRLEKLLSRTDYFNHTYTETMLLSFACLTDWITRSHDRLARHAAEVVVLSTKYGFPLWRAWGTAFQGWASAVLKKDPKGLEALAEGLAAIRATGTILMTPYWLMLLAEAHGKLGRPNEGLSLISEAEKILETAEERFVQAELFRLKGELLNSVGNQTAAEKCYLRAIRIAQQQNAKVWELRAAINFARLCSSQGRSNGGVLTLVYRWFTEGQDTPDLVEARLLLSSSVRTD